MEQSGEVRRVITGLIHGGHAIADNAPNFKEAIDNGSIAFSAMTQDPEPAGPICGTTDFEYLFKDLIGDESKHLPSEGLVEVTRTVGALIHLASAMIEAEPPADLKNSPIPPVYTYWGQFVDHDMTAATDNDDEISIRVEPLPPLPPDHVTSKLKNARNPALNLDSLYGDGPFAPPPPPPPPGKAAEVVVPYQEQDKAKLEIGTLTLINVGVRIPHVDDIDRDLPRIDKVAQIGDARNDENLVVAQLHLAFLRFHNAAVDWVRTNEPELVSVEAVFLRARDLTRWAYQWLSIHDFLATVTQAGTVDDVLAGESDLLGLVGRKKPYMPLEFSVAAYRFGHSMIRGSYDWNRNFGRPGNNTAPRAGFAQLFQFTGRGGFTGTAKTLPSNWPVEWDRFVDKNSLFEDRFARRIDTHLALPLRDMVNQLDAKADTERLKILLKHLAQRNLLRGFRLGLPTGQAVAEALGIPPLSPDQLTERVDPEIVEALAHGNFLERTPLWFYVLRESERNAQGNTLGAVGSRIVAETIIGQIRYDPTSFLHQSGWSPNDGVRLPDGSPIRSIADFLRFAGVL